VPRFRLRYFRNFVGVVLQMGASSSAQIFDLVGGQVVQSFSPGGDSSGSFLGITYSAVGSLYPQISTITRISGEYPWVPVGVLA